MKVLKLYVSNPSLIQNTLLNFNNNSSNKKFSLKYITKKVYYFIFA